MLGSFDMCEKPSNFFLLESAFRSFFAVIATHILSGEVDTTLSDGNLLSKISWLLRYFNPVNLCWRYYSMLAYRCLSKDWGDKQLALINFEAYPFRAPIPYVVGEKIEEFRVRRLEISGVVSSQGLLSIIAAYQGIMAVQFVISSAGFGFLPIISKPMAILGLFRVMVSNWIASRVFVEPFPYPSESTEIDCRSNRLVCCIWVSVLAGLVMLSFWPFIGYPEFSFPEYYMDLSMEFLYQYTAISIFFFHLALLSYGPKGLANRIMFFDHWVYKLQTFGFILVLLGILAIGIVDFVRHDYYRFCE